MEPHGSFERLACCKDESVVTRSSDDLNRCWQTYPDNYTRFGVLSRSPDPLDEPDKTSLVFGVDHVAGSLYRCLGAFAERHLNLSKLESRPRPGRPWEYVFYADVDAPAQQEEMVEALAALSDHATFTRVLGTYSAAVHRHRRAV
jgi:prephenate dehydratase